MQERKTIVVVGNGMVGHRFCERLAEIDEAGEFRVVAFGEERQAAYDRVHLSSFFDGSTAEDLRIADPAWYAERGYSLRLGECVARVDRERAEVHSDRGACIAYDQLVLATGSEPFVPPLPGTEHPGVFVYRTLDDLERIAAWAKRDGVRRAAVVGGGLLGLEAAKATVDLGLETTVVEFADRLMPRQVDVTGGALLERAIESLGVRIRTGARTEEILGDGQVTGMRFAEGPDLPVDLVLISAGIRARDDLAREAGLEVGERGGIAVGDSLTSSDPKISAIGECAVHAGAIYGLVGPGYEMADVLARTLCGHEARFEGADLSTKLKLLGVDVASFGDAFGDVDGIAARRVVVEDRVAGVYQKLVMSADGEKLLGGILVGDAEPYHELLQCMNDGGEIPKRPHELLTGAAGALPGSDVGAIAEDAQICSCNNVTKGAITSAIAGGEADTLADLKRCTRAGSGCGGCIPLVTKIFETEQTRLGQTVSRSLCEHFDHTRQELFTIVKLGRIESFEALLASHGRGDGCEVCRPVVASILASSWNDVVVDHAAIQDTNDRYLANIQRGGTYSVIPRVPGGEITPDKLIVIGEVAKEFDLYCKITGGQRIDLLGARVDQLPEIWKTLVAAGFESGHAYGKAMRTVKSCVGSSWCRYGVQDSTGFAIRVEERYRGLRAPHKLKSAVSGCIRECAEAQNKDFGIIATEQGWNLYLCGNGGSNPRHADLFAADIDDDTVLRYVDRFLMFYIQTAKPLQRTARWLEELDGGIDALKRIVIDDSLGICEQLETDMQQLVDGYVCEWAEVVKSPERRRWFSHYADSDDADERLAFIPEREQKRPADWNDDARQAAPTPPEEDWSWVRLARVDSFPENGGRAIRRNGRQIAVFRFAQRGEWYATDNVCPHRRESVLARGLLGSEKGEPKVACPLHKKTFSLHTGKGLADPSFQVQTFPVEVRGDEVWAKLPAGPGEAAATPCSGSCG